VAHIAGVADLDRQAAAQVTVNRVKLYSASGQVGTRYRTRTGNRKVVSMERRGSNDREGS